ncbi:MAG: hypothetical protein ACXQTI_01395 [Candidatus Nezhaarchaeales archaeon]
MREIRVIDVFRGAWEAIEKFLEAPPKRILGILVVALTCLFLSGGLFCIIMGTPAVITTPHGFVFYYPGIDYQTGAEAFIVFLLMIMGTAGLLMIHQNMKQPRSRSRSMALTLLGLLLIAMSMLALVWLIYLKVLFYV